MRAGVMMILVACRSHHDVPVVQGEHFCRSVDPSAPLRLAIANTKTVVYGDDAGCPAESSRCKRDALARGDEAIVAREDAGFACVWYPKAGGDMGWVSASTLDSVPAERALTWTKTWVVGDNQIVIEQTSEGVKARGHGIWRGYGKNVHEGTFEGSVTFDVTGTKAVLDDSPCQVRMNRIGHYLVAADNGECGGVNVRFDAVYTNRSPASGPYLTARNPE